MEVAIMSSNEDECSPETWDMDDVPDAVTHTSSWGLLQQDSSATMSCANQQPGAFSEKRLSSQRQSAAHHSAGGLPAVVIVQQLSWQLGVQCLMLLMEAGSHDALACDAWKEFHGSGV